MDKKKELKLMSSKRYYNKRKTNKRLLKLKQFQNLRILIKLIHKSY